MYSKICFSNYVYFLINYSLYNSKLYGKGGKWTISVEVDVYGMSLGRGLHFAQDWNFLPARATNTIFCHAPAFIDHGKGNVGIYATIRLNSISSPYVTVNNIDWKRHKRLWVFGNSCLTDSIVACLKSVKIKSGFKRMSFSLAWSCKSWNKRV